MNDFLVELGKRKRTRKLIKTLGIPIPLPQDLKREKNGWQERPLEDRDVVVSQVRKSPLTPFIAKTLAGAGAKSWVTGEKPVLDAFAQEGSAWGRLPKKAEETPDGLKPHALVFDAAAIEKPEELEEMYALFHNRARGLAPCGRAVVIGRPAAGLPPAQAAACQALEGFVRSMAKELGKNGATAQLLYVDPGAEDRLEPVLRFFLSHRSAYVTGQPVHITAAVAQNGVPAKTRVLEGKSALVTGAARGIGAAIARALAREGAHVIIMDRPSEEEPVSQLASEIHGTPLLCDLTDKDAGKKILDLVKSKFKGLDVVIHNAGITRDKLLVNMKEEVWRQTLDVNLVSLMRVNEALKASLNKGGRIVCLSSIAGIAGNRGQTNYAASKSGVIGYIRALAAELAGSGIAVNAVAPGFIETQMTAGIPFATREVARRLCSLGQGGLPQDVAEVVTFLASPGAAGLSGEVIRICGGNFIGA